MDQAQKFELFRNYHEKEDLVEEIIQDFYSRFLLVNESTSIDCGCHKGFHTIPLSRCCREVIGIDANGDMCLFLEDQIKQSGLPNCKIIHGAVQDDEQLQSVTFYVSDNFLGRSSLTKLWNAIDDKVTYRPITAPAMTLDSLATRLNCNKVDFIKLDLEGGEYKALKGAVNLLRRDQPVFVMENSVHAGKQGGFMETDPFDYLTELGYLLLTPDGTQVSRNKLFPFWYLFGVPTHKLDYFQPLLSAAYYKICSSRNLFSN